MPRREGHNGVRGYISRLSLTPRCTPPHYKVYSCEVLGGGWTAHALLGCPPPPALHSHAPFHLRHPSLSLPTKAKPLGPELGDAESGGGPPHRYLCCTPMPRAHDWLELPPLVLPLPACMMLRKAGLVSDASGSSVPGLAAAASWMLRKCLQCE